MKPKRASTIRLWFLIILGFLTLTATSPRAFAQADPDLAIPKSDSSAEEDAIMDAKKKESDVSDEDAQKRGIPKKPEHYLELLPSEEVDQPPPVIKVEKNGTRLYKVKEKPQKYSGGIRIGPFNPSKLVGDSGISYDTIYGTGTVLVDFNAEYQFMQSFGKLGVRADLGIFVNKGQGRFAHNSSELANETITIVGLPISGGVVYHLQYWKRQLFIPYAEAGGDYIPFFEIRSDLPKFSENVKYGGAPAAHVAGGLQIQLDFLDKDASFHLNDEYGISHIYLTFDVRQIVGLSSTFDFTSLIYEGGFLFEF